MNVFHQLKQLIMKDVSNENEARKTALIIRLFTLILGCYFVFQCIILSVFCNIYVAILGLVCVVLNLMLFGMTYLNHTQLTLFLVQLLTVSWIILYVYTLGWDCGVQHFIFVILILNFVVGQNSNSIKILYAIFLCCLRIGLYTFNKIHISIFTLTATSGAFMQIINTIFIFILMTVIVVISNSESIAMEQKLTTYNEHIRKMALIDPLTNLYNRRAITDKLEKLTSKQHYEHNLLSIALGDIDFFKKVNDTYGHDAGDAVLVFVAEQLLAMIRPYGYVSRWGGEEFLLVFKNSNGDDAYTILNNFRHSLKKMQIPYKDEIIHITMTFGLEEYDDNLGIDKTISNADKKLYKGKENGRNCVEY
ncbi:MAG: GGDEF domain-containing protein [Eubacteriales bacterium]|nr:GGDEF domain-containing protein [Lachnospiraceae bacterium]MDO5127725.1 GGDEF domain-containing protein [Eubacteriales bacterium]